MAHIALYRKYRSKTFDDVCGQEQVTSVLKYQASSGRVSHAYLFTGSRGTGKTSCAKILAKSVNCENPKDGEPCGVCEACRMIDRGSATDVVEMDAASETGVDYIRSIKEEVQYPPALLKKRVYIIDEVHMLSESAFNALLKTLEEPPEHVIFILATTELYKLPSTVVSRCQRFDFRRLPIDVITARLDYIAKSEGIVLESGAAQIIARQAQGGMRDAISLLDLCAGGGADVTEERVKDILGVSGYENVAKTAAAIADRDAGRLFEITASVASSSKDIGVFWRELSSFYRDMLVCRYAKDPKSYLDLTEGDFELLKSSAERFTLASLFYGSKVLDTALRDMVRSPETKRITAEFALMKLCDEALDTSNEALSARVEALERTVEALKRGAVVTSANVENKREVASKANVENRRKESTPSAPETEALVREGKLPAPGTKSAADMRFRKVPDPAEVLDIVGRQNFMTRALLSEATLELRDDGAAIRILTENEFAATYFDAAQKTIISDAFIEAKLNDRASTVEIVVKKQDEPLYEELFNNIDNE